MFRIMRRHNTHLWSATTVALALILVLSTAAYAGGPVVHEVTAGGPDFCEALGYKPGCDANFSLSARQYADGTVEGEYTDRFGLVGGFHAKIDCLSVDGNQAWVSGTITDGVIHQDSGEDLDLAGLPVANTVRDNGTSANDPPDEISFSHVGDLAFPCTKQPKVHKYWFEVPQGQVTVK